MTGYWRTPPPAPGGFSVARTDKPGHFQLAWTRPKSDKVRHYNVYYSTEGPPRPVQANRIASPPVGTSSYLDWLADSHAPEAHYAITAVDRQGNESKPARASAAD